MYKSLWLFVQGRTVAQWATRKTSRVAVQSSVSSTSSSTPAATTSGPLARTTSTSPFGSTNSTAWSSTSGRAYSSNAGAAPVGGQQAITSATASEPTQEEKTRLVKEAQEDAPLPARITRMMEQSKTRRKPATNDAPTTVKQVRKIIGEGRVAIDESKKAAAASGQKKKKHYNPGNAAASAGGPIYLRLANALENLEDKSALRAEDWEAALSVVSESQILMNDRRDRFHLIEAVERVAELARQQLEAKGQHLTLHMYTTLLSTYVDAGNQEKAENVLEMVQSSGQPMIRLEKIIFSKKLANVGSMHALDLISSIVRDPQGNVTPVLPAYAEVCELLILRHVYDDRASPEMREKVLAVVDLNTLNDLKQKYHKNTRSDAQRLYNNIRLMFVYGAMGDTKQAMEHLNELANNGKGSTFLAHRRLVQVGKITKNHDLVIKSFQEMVEKHQHNNQFTYGPLALDAAESYVATGKVDEAVRLIQAETSLLVYKKQLNDQFAGRALRLFESVANESAEASKLVEELRAQVEFMNTPKNDRVSRQPPLLAAIPSQNPTVIVPILREHIAAGRPLSFGITSQLLDIFEEKQCAEGIVQLASPSNKFATWSALRAGILSLADQRRYNESWQAFQRFRDMVTKQQRYVGMSFYARLVHAYAMSGHHDWSADVIDALESTVIYDRNGNSNGYANTTYQSALQGLINTADLKRSLSLYERMVQPHNPLQIVPTLTTYHFLMLTAVTAWNAEAVESLYSKLRDLSINKPPVPVAANARDALIELSHYRKEFYAALKEKYGEAPAPKEGGKFEKVYPVQTIDDVVIPGHIRANRITENIRMLSLTVSDQADKALESFKESLTVYPSGAMPAPEERSFHMVVMAFLRKKGDPQFNDRARYTSKGTELKEKWGDKDVTQENVDDLFAMADAMTTAMLEESKAAPPATSETATSAPESK